MAQNDKTDFDPEGTSSETLAEKLNLQTLIEGLVGDLTLLRQGKISVRDARARAELARQILRGVHYVVTAQKFIEQQSRRIQAPEDGDA